MASKSGILYISLFLGYVWGKQALTVQQYLWRSRGRSPSSITAPSCHNKLPQAAPAKPQRRIYDVFGKCSPTPANLTAGARATQRSHRVLSSLARQRGKCFRCDPNFAVSLNSFATGRWLQYALFAHGTHGTPGPTVYKSTTGFQLTDDPN